jgi:cathepsin L
MMRAVILAAVAALAAAKPTWKDLEGYSFEQFLADFKIPLERDSTEFASRKAVFLSELVRVRLHNKSGKSWKEGINKYSAMTADEKKAIFGRSKGVNRSHKPANLKAPLHSIKKVSELPESVDWRSTGIVNAVKDQGHCGSCWAFASTSVIESAVAKASGLLMDLSVQQIAMCSPNPDSCGGTGGCHGATAEIAFDYVANSQGLQSEYQYSYQAYYGAESPCLLTNSSNYKKAATIDGFVQLPQNDYASLMNAIAEVGPIAISVDASTWHSYESGIYNGCNQVNPDIDHAVVLVGYGVDNGQKYWTVRNSWSPHWGEKGHIRLARSDDEDSLCGMDTDPSDGIACAGQTEPVKVCGTCGIIFDSAYPTGAKAE